MTDTRFQFLTSDRIFQSSDLKKDRALLDAARGGVARLRDTDGMGLVMLTESGLMQLAEAQRREHFLAETGAELHRVRLLMRELGEDGRLNALTLGQWSWLEQFDADDLNEFLDEMATALVRRDEAAVADALMGWQETASALADPERMAALTGDHDPDDYVDVPRPEADGEADEPQPVVAVPAAG
jgi:hypothetical protein